MFDNIGWGEILVVVIIGVIIIGPERLPGVIEDCRAAIFAARKAINNAKKELNGEFDGAFDEIKEPLSQVAKIASMSPRAAITKHLLDGDDLSDDLSVDLRQELGEKPQLATNGERQETTRRTHQAKGPAPVDKPGGTPGFTYGEGTFNDVM